MKLHELLAQQGLDRRIDTIVVFAGIAEVKVRPKPIPVLYRNQVFKYVSQLPDVLSNEEVTKYKEGVIKLIN